MLWYSRRQRVRSPLEAEFGDGPAGGQKRATPDARRWYFGLRITYLWSNYPVTPYLPPRCASPISKSPPEPIVESDTDIVSTANANGEPGVRRTPIVLTCAIPVRWVETARSAKEVEEGLVGQTVLSRLRKGGRGR